MHTESLNELPSWQHFPILSSVILGGIKRVLFDCIDRGLWKLKPDFPQTLLCAPLLTVGTFTIIKHSPEYTYILNFVRLRELLTLRVVLETVKHIFLERYHQSITHGTEAKGNTNKYSVCEEVIFLLLEVIFLRIF